MFVLVTGNSLWNGQLESFSYFSSLTIAPLHNPFVEGAYSMIVGYYEAHKA
jgi:hypothetical protein